MGCEETREGIEEKMLYTRLEREEVKRQKKLLMEELKLSTGKVYKSEKIPDFVDIKYIKEKKRKHYEKLVKEEVKRVEEKKKKEQKKREELEKELEEERKKELLLYMPMDMKVNNQNNDLEDIYYLNYVLDKKHKDHKKDKDRNENHKKTKKEKHKEKEKHKRHSTIKSNEEKGDEDKEDDDHKEDYIEHVNAKIRTKVGSARSILDNKENNEKNKNENDDDSGAENESKKMQYVTPHLQPND